MVSYTGCNYGGNTEQAYTKYQYFVWTNGYSSKFLKYFPPEFKVKSLITISIVYGYA